MTRLDTAIANGLIFPCLTGSIIREARPQSVVVSDVSSSLVDDFVGSQLDDGEMKKRCTYHQGDDIQVRLFCAG